MNIGPQSKLTIATAGTLILSAVTVTALFVSIKTDSAMIRHHIATDWTLRDMILWTSKLSDANKTNLFVPDPESTWKRFNLSQ